MTDAERAGALSAIASEVATCTRCRLHATRTRAVPGEGSPDTEVVFVGEGPGFNEDRQGRPFVGAAGAFLGELLGSVGWRREDVFITNVVKCRPPENRDPEPDEIAACAPYLARQLAALDPALVVTLGRHSMGRFMPGARIGQVHGTSRPADPSVGAPDAHVFAMYHPAAALHQGALRQTLLDDMLRVPAALLASREERARHERAVAAASAPELDAPTGSAAPSEAIAPADTAPPAERIATDAPTQGEPPGAAATPAPASSGADSHATSPSAPPSIEDEGAAQGALEMTTSESAGPATEGAHAGPADSRTVERSADPGVPTPLTSVPPTGASPAGASPTDAPPAGASPDADSGDPTSQLTLF